MLHARAILGLPVDTTLKSPGASAVIYGGVDATGPGTDGDQRFALVVLPRQQGPDLHGLDVVFQRLQLGVGLGDDAGEHRERLGVVGLVP